MWVLLTFVLAATAVFGASETELLTEKIRDVSPDGKYAFRIIYDRALNEQMLPKETAPKGGIFSQTIDSMAIVSLPQKGVIHELTEAVLRGGNEFRDITLLWSVDSKWCAFYCTYPRVGYTLVFHLRGDKFTPAHPPDELENMTPVRWAKPGVLDLRVEDAPALTANFDGKGKVKFLKKK